MVFKLQNSYFVTMSEEDVVLRFWTWEPLPTDCLLGPVPSETGSALFLISSLRSSGPKCQLLTRYLCNYVQFNTSTSNFLPFSIRHFKGCWWTPAHPSKPNLIHVSSLLILSPFPGSQGTLYLHPSCHMLR